MYKKPFLTVLLCLAAYTGDYIVFKSKFSDSQIFRAFSDSVVHATLGFLSAVLFLSYEKLSLNAYIANVLFCTVVSSLIDIDHIFVARSLQWKDLTNLKQRGVLHCTTFWITLTLLLLVCSYTYKMNNIYIATYMLILAFTSHHLRDANRRGLWLHPYGHTRPLNKHFYIFLVSILPHVWAWLYGCMKHNVYSHKTVYQNV